MGSVAGRGAAQAEPAARQGLVFAAGFVLGIATVDAAIGGLFGFVGDVVIRALAGSLAVTNLVLAGLLVALGLALLRVIHVPWLRWQVPRIERAMACSSCSPPSTSCTRAWPPPGWPPLEFLLADVS